MLRALELIGLPVVEVEHGKKLGECKDFLFDSGWLLSGILLSSKRWYCLPKYIPREEVLFLGEDAITVKAKLSVRPLKSTESYSAFELGRRKLRDLPVFSENGLQLGRIADIYLDLQSGDRLTGCELTDGFISDITKGRLWLPLPEEFQLGEDSVIVPDGSDAMLKAIETSNE